MQRASSKGLVCGSRLTIHLVGGDVVEVNDTEGTLIPASEDIAHFDVDDELVWVLIVEKEVCVALLSCSIACLMTSQAVFQTLCRLNFASHPALPGPGLIITVCIFSRAARILF